MGEPEFIRRKKAERETAKQGKQSARAPQSVIDERRRQKSDTDSGMTAEQKRAVLAEEETYRDRFTETGAIVLPNGKIAARTVKGGRNQASFRVEDVIRYGKDAVFTHNHPDHEYDSQGHTSKSGVGMAQRIGNTMSNADLYLAAMANAKEMRANTPTYTYSVRRGKNGWGGTPDEIRRTWDREYNKQTAEMIAHARKVNRYSDVTVKGKDGSNATYAGNRVFLERWARMNALATHRAMKAVAEKYGLEYTRVKRHEKSAHDEKIERQGKANKPRERKPRKQQSLADILRARLGQL